MGLYCYDMNYINDYNEQKCSRIECYLTANYNTIGQILKTKSDAFVYLGEWYKHFTIYNNRGSCYGGSATKNYPKLHCLIPKQPTN